jgi:hypothetical protein
MIASSRLCWSLLSAAELDMVCKADVQALALHGCIIMSALSAAEGGTLYKADVDALACMHKSAVPLR